jgi:hypothetical protein
VRLLRDIDAIPAAARPLDEAPRAAAARHRRQARGRATAPRAHQRDRRPDRLKRFTSHRGSRHALRGGGLNPAAARPYLES